eukprot:TRINITY_DN61731_c0_g1_i1.p1 TRINITY_DN61731_c0_g1~~TRINITY_DN61731_c0_g1_i1.p1  ORF type:complete len:327 (-),score=52.90 TRINITY_DN61731_c0_g1_i1:150-1130(-)
MRGALQSRLRCGVSQSLLGRRPQVPPRGIRAAATSTPSGNTLLTAGKHKGISFNECVSQDPKYCAWVLKRGSGLGGEYAGFQEFLRTREGQQPARDDTADNVVDTLAVETITTPVESSVPVAQVTEALPTPVPTSPSVAEPASVGGDGSGPQTELNFGKHRGSCFQEILRQDPNYCRWILKELTRPDIEATEGFLEFAHWLQTQGVEAAGPSQRGSKRVEAAPRPQANQPPVAAPAQNPEPQQKQPPTPAASRTPGADLASGQWLVTFGKKHVDRTFEEVVALDWDFCQWVVNTVLSKDSHAPPEMISFATYILHRCVQNAQQGSG